METTKGDTKVEIETKKDQTKDEKAETKNRVPFSKLFRYATPWDKFLLFMGSLGAIANGCSLPIFAIIFGRLINSFNDASKGVVLDEVEKYASYLAILSAAAWVCSWLEVALWMNASERQARVLREEYLKAVLRQEIAWFDKQKPGEISSRLASDTKMFQEGISNKVSSYIHFMATFFCGLTIGLVYGWQLAMVIISLTPLLSIVGGLMAKLLASFTTKGQKAYAKAGGIAEESLSSSRTVQAYSGEEFESTKYLEKLKEAMNMGIRGGFVQGASLGMATLILFGSYGLSLWYGLKIIGREKSPLTGDYYTGGDIMTVLFSVIIGAMALGQAAPSLPVMVKGQVSVYPLFELIDRKPLIDPLSEEGIKSSINGHIRFENVAFRYPSNLEKSIFTKLNLEIRAGETVALVGHSGCGKSTIVSLIERFYDPDEGAIYCDNLNLKEINLKHFRQNVGLVQQEPILFHTSIRQNIAYGKPSATNEEIVSASKAANCHDFIQQLEHGYDTIVGDKGKLLSGGQKQRIAIARAILKNPKILLLDEATSALDAENERLVQQALDRLMSNRTTIIVAHRLSTVRNANRIIVLGGGQVLETGNHEELMARGGPYAKLYQTHSEEKTDLIDEKKTAFNVTKRESVTSDTMKLATEKEEEKQEVKEIPLSRILPYSKDENQYFVLGLIGAAGSGVGFPLFSVIFAEMVRIFYVPDSDSEAGKYAVLFFVLGVSMAISYTLQWGMMGIVGEKLTLKLRLLSFKNMMKQSMGWFDQSKNAVGTLVTRLSTDASLIQGLSVNYLGQLIQVMSMIICGLVIAFINGWKLTLVVLCIGPLVAIASAAQFKFIGGFASRSRAVFEESGRISNEAIANIRTVSTFTAEADVVRNYCHYLDLALKVNLGTGHASGIGFGTSQFIMFSAYALSFWYGAKLVRNDEMTFGNVMKVFFSIVLSAMGVGQTSQFAPDYAKAKLAANHIFSLLELVPSIDSSSKEGKQLSITNADIEFRDVHFHYPTRPDTKIFKGLNLRVKGRTTLAVVGESGSGKSSLVGLIERFYDPISGTVLIDGQNLTTLNVSSLRRHMAIVSQEPILFTGTVAENIRYSKPDATEEEVREAAKVANIHDFIMGLPKGYDTILGAGGVKLSGGEKQRVAIARAIIRKPPILLLDEATSALDSKNEKLVQEALDAVMKNRTTIVIAHRLSTIKNADAIVVLDKGEVVEGPATHDELLSLRGFYAKQWALSTMGDVQSV